MADTPTEKKEGFFHYTQGKAWGGTQIDPTLFKSIVVLFGFFGLDHLLLRSPITAILKFFVNLVSLGFWYWYDVLQTFSDFENLKKYGYSLPIFGPSGLGAGMIHDVGKPKAPAESPTPLYFVAFALTSLIPYGISHVIAGDYLGAFLKFSLSISFFTFLFGWLWALYTFGNMLLNSQSLFKNGTDRLFPLSFIFGQYGPDPMLKWFKPEPKEPDCPPGVFEEYFLTIVNFFKMIWEHIILLPKKILDALFPPVKEAVEKTIEVATEVVKQTKEVVEPPVQQVTKLTTEIPKVLTNTVSELASYTDPAKLQAIAEKQAVQAGGALVLAESPSLFNLMVVGILVASIVGGLAVTYMRTKNAKTEPENEQNDVPPAVQRKERNDSPPGPRVL